jgi:quaternary ammonium compound-resistance protein SugE
LIVNWLILAFAGLFEVVWAVGLKYTDGFTRLYPSLITLAGALVSFFLLAYAMKTLPLGTAYAVWVGIGTIGAFIAGIVLFGESVGWIRLFSVALILAGLVGLKVSSP